MKFKSKDEIKKFIDNAVQKNGLDDRDHLARVIGISSSTLYGYIYRVEIPDKVYKKLQGSLKQFGATAVQMDETAVENTDITKVTLDDLLAEIERRGWKVDLSRLPKN